MAAGAWLEGARVVNGMFDMGMLKDEC